MHGLQFNFHVTFVHGTYPVIARVLPCETIVEVDSFTASLCRPTGMDHGWVWYYSRDRMHAMCSMSEVKLVCVLTVSYDSPGKLCAMSLIC